MTMYRPRICYENFIKSADITVSSNTDNKERLIDRNEERKWVAVGEGEAATITLAVTSAIDTIIIQNTNIKTFTIKYNTSTNFTPTLSEAQFTLSNTFNNIYAKVSSVTPSTNVKLVVTATTDGLSVKIGQIVVTKEIMEITAGGTAAVVPEVRQFMTELSDGTKNKIYVRTTKGYDLTLLNVTTTERANLLTLAEYNRSKTFFYIHRPAWDVDYFDGLCGHMNWENPVEFDDYFNDISANGFMGTLRFRQAGGRG